MIRKNIVCIFAHPDDEAFGPGGTIALLAKEYNVYILCATKGEAGMHHNIDLIKDIPTIRAKEAQESAKVLGVKKIYFLGFEDGTLCNNSYHKLAAVIEEHLKKLKPEILLTFEPRGISGHIDHIAVSMVTTYVFCRNNNIKQLHYYCLNETLRSRVGEYFVYFPPGYKEKQIDKVVDVSETWDLKLKAMHCHKSQLHDIHRIIKQREGLPKEEYFMILEH